MEFERRLYLVQVCSPSVHEYGLSYISGELMGWLFYNVDGVIIIPTH